MNDNPMHPTARLRNAPRCRAKTKATGSQCMAPAVRGWRVCRMHGAGGGAPRGKGNGMWRHGCRSLDLTEARREIAELNRLARSTMADLD